MGLTLPPHGAPVVLHYTGHRMTGPDNPFGIQPGSEAAVSTAIAAVLHEYRVLAAHGSLASGADILFAEAFRAAAIPFYIWLPFASACFKPISVAPAGVTWLARFDIVVSSAAAIHTLPDTTPGRGAFARCADAAMQAACTSARAADAAALQLAVWNGRHGNDRGGTWSDILAWSKRGLPSRIISIV